MLFNSVEFLLFLPVVFAMYWFVFKKPIHQNILILCASYFFYGWWDWRFLFLIIFSTLVDYSIGLLLHNEKVIRKRKILLWTSIFVNLGLLGYLKYYNFFINNFITAFDAFGVEISESTLNIILPVGISFYTFQTLSYTIDVYRKKVIPTNNFIAFAAFVTFFPQLVAGPIERAAHLLPQFYKKRVFDYRNAVIGMRLILWGFFQKIVIADGCAPYVNDIFENYMNYSSITLIFGSVLFSFQIYGDFAGYSNIAIGVSRLFGFDLMRNFKYPYFSRDIAEFWRRWHISLSTWFRDYLYIPIGGSKGGKYSQVRNVFVIFIVSGFWHGANWTFIVWGALNALYFLPLLLLNKNRTHLDDFDSKTLFPTVKVFVQMCTTFILITFAWIFFRSDNITVAIDFIKHIFVNSNYLKISSAYTYNHNIRPLAVYLVFFILLEWFSRDREQFVNTFFERNTYLRYAMYVIITLVIILNIQNEASGFIYFQF
ncbi:MAG: membrane-bound O-acyltransferase family protein [Kordia sp.]|nr:MAG: membrane-bound O-acyltransferase family protein [Kordia sp.]